MPHSSQINLTTLNLQRKELSQRGFDSQDQDPLVGELKAGGKAPECLSWAWGKEATLPPYCVHQETDSQL